MEQWLIFLSGIIGTDWYNGIKKEIGIGKVEKTIGQIEWQIKKAEGEISRIARKIEKRGKELQQPNFPSNYSTDSLSFSQKTSQTNLTYSNSKREEFKEGEKLKTQEEWEEYWYGRITEMIKKRQHSRPSIPPLPQPPPPYRVKITGWADFNPVGGYADGRYQLASTIEKGAPKPGWRKLILVFKRKKGMFVLRQDEEIWVKMCGYQLEIYYPFTEQRYRLEFTPKWRIEGTGKKYSATYSYPARQIIIERNRVHMVLTFTPQ